MWTALGVLLLSGGAAEAHTFGVHGAGLVQGFGHPFGGLDHLLAMVAVGLWAAQQGGRALWLVPAAFMTSMVAGGGLGLAGAPLPMVELGIAASLMVLGAVVALSFRPPVWVGMALVGLFALFHGHAHGAEMPEAAFPVLYAAGFVAATGLLHAVGVAACLGLGRSRTVARVAVRSAGAAVAATGVLIAIL
ncbi:MAG: HupE/UreJ family protein [Alphaproteobacteria bacterium]|nr:HupE/UreJ family protein [Alphaproteobacteria bacterium]MBF0129506.1 HupE/UreJ family protein [Alphaproteobacteria bacterium]